MPSEPKTTIKRILGIDFETASRQRASACSVGLFLKDFNSHEALFEKEILIDPECDFDYFNSLVNCITPSTVKGCEPFPAAASVIASLIDEQTTVIAHNASFDISVYRKSCERYGLQIPRFQYLCTYVMARNLLSALPSYSLDYLTSALDLPAFNHHNALSDAKACVSLFEKLMSDVNCTSTGQLTLHCGVVQGTTIDNNNYRPCHKSSDSKRQSYVSEQSVDVCDIDDSNPLYQKTVVFTGTLSSCTRSEAFLRVEQVGGIPSENLNKSTNFLVYGFQDPFFLNGKEKSTKLIRAEKLIAKGADLQIVSEDEYERLFDI